jgi:hypothetical protein
MNEQEVLRKPFDVETHKKTFIRYLEVVILEDGTIVYAIPSHQEKLIAVACQKHSVTRDQLADMCPPEYYFDYMAWLCEMSGCVSVWINHIFGSPNNRQLESLKMLADERLYEGEVFQ